MIGAIIGDIVGSSYEFNPTNDYLFEMFPAGCNYTDDTICTIAVADAILGKRPYKDTVHSWCRKNQCPMGGYGGMFAQWVASSDPKPYNSFGNGSAMRVSSIGWLFDTQEEVLEEAMLSSVISHDHPDGIRGAQAVAYAVWYARNNRVLTIQQIVEHVAYKFGYEVGMLERYANRFDETCQGTIPAAFACLRESNNFEDAIRHAVFIGADADTLGAIVGGIAEAYYGAPVDLVQKALSYLPRNMLNVYNKFKLCLTS